MLLKMDASLYLDSVVSGICDDDVTLVIDRNAVRTNEQTITTSLAKQEWLIYASTI